MSLGHHGRRWRRDEYLRLRDVCKDASLSSIKVGVLMSGELQRTAASITTMIAELGLRPRKPKQVRIGHPRDGRPHDTGAFARAMNAAIAAGTEKPPMVGIDRTPGTKAPIMIGAQPSWPCTESVLADL